MVEEDDRPFWSWSRIRGGKLSFQDIWEFEPNDKFLRRMKIAEGLKTGALANQVIGTGMDTHAYFGGEAEGEWTRDAKEYVMVTGSLLNLSAAALDWLGGPEARKAAAKQQIVGIQQQALDFKPVRFGWNPERTQEDFERDPRDCWVFVTQAQRADAIAQRDADEQYRGWSDNQAFEHFYERSATAMNQSIMAIVVQANGADVRSSLTLGKAALQTLTTVKGQWDSEKTGEDPGEPDEPPGPVFLPPRGDPPPGAGPVTDPETLLASAPPPGSANSLGGTASAPASPSLGPTGAFAGVSRPGPIGGFMGAPHPGGRGTDGRRGEEERYARQWEVTEEDGEIWGTGTIGATDSGVLR